MVPGFQHTNILSSFANQCCLLILNDSKAIRIKVTSTGVLSLLSVDLALNKSPEDILR